MIQSTGNLNFWRAEMLRRHGFEGHAESLAKMLETLNTGHWPLHMPPFWTAGRAASERPMQSWSQPHLARHLGRMSSALPSPTKTLDVSQLIHSYLIILDHKCKSINNKSHGSRENVLGSPTPEESAKTFRLPCWGDCLSQWSVGMHRPNSPITHLHASERYRMPSREHCTAAQLHSMWRSGCHPPRWAQTMEHSSRVV